MNRFTDYFYAAVPGVCLAIPFAQILPDLTFLQGIEKLGIVGIMASGIIFFVMERRSFIAKSGERLGALEKRLGVLETKVASGNDKVIHLLGEQLDALKEIKNGQSENFSRMWQLTLRSLSPQPDGQSIHSFRNDNDAAVSNRFPGDEEVLFRPQSGSAED